MKCSVDTCLDNARANGMCQKHYRRNKKHGTTEPTQRSRGPLKDRFWLYVDKKTENECWEWRGAIGLNGYGRAHEKGRKDIRAHRFSYEITKGEIPKGLVVMHTCDNRKCVNPNHLILGTYNDNMQDMITKNRAIHKSVKGEAHSRVKLTEEQVLEIRANKHNTYGQIAVSFGVSRSTISAIKNRYIWKHI